MTCPREAGTLASVLGVANIRCEGALCLLVELHLFFQHLLLLEPVNLVKAVRHPLLGVHSSPNALRNQSWLEHVFALCGMAILQLLAPGLPELCLLVQDVGSRPICDQVLAKSHLALVEPQSSIIAAFEPAQDLVFGVALLLPCSCLTSLAVAVQTLDALCPSAEVVVPGVDARGERMLQRHIVRGGEPQRQFFPSMLVQSIDAVT
mmetsp:Transcript_6149/g.17959  ORF Transcript_6149/g.17959 Transcript_6149/m.17959 type:complete len:206 (-) Transcript_6149:358-975(-)